MFVLRHWQCWFYDTQLTTAWVWIIQKALIRFVLTLPLRFLNNNKKRLHWLAWQLKIPYATTSANFSCSAAKLDQASGHSVDTKRFGMARTETPMQSISVVTPKVVCQFCYDALTMFSYRKANHFIDAAKLLFKVSVSLSSMYYLILRRKETWMLSSFVRTLNRSILLLLA